MKLLATISLSFIILISFAGNNEWINLFDGKTLNGWKQISGTAKYFAKDGIITGVSVLESPNSFLATEKNYQDFVLEYEMKMDEGLNSGVQIRSHSYIKNNDRHAYGLQVECDDSNRAWSGGLYDEGRRGWRYPLEYNPAAKTAFKKQKWNKYRVVAYGNRILTWVNGISCSNLVEEEVESGFIALQVHAIYNESNKEKQIQWRNIRIRPANENDLKVLDSINTPEVSFLKNKLTEKEKKDGWKLLWDGKSSEGWRGAKIEHFPEKGWSLNDGELTVIPADGAESGNGGDIVTKKMYGKFILELEFKITEGANSGIKYFVNTELNKGEGSAIGCEYQILDDKNHPDAKLGVADNRTLASLYDLIAANGQYFNPDLPNRKYVNRMGMWNKARIVSDGETIQHYLNGCKVVEYNRKSQMWKALVAYSKYKEWPNFGELEKGNILLQDHGNEVSFRSIKIKELP